MLQGFITYLSGSSAPSHKIRKSHIGIVWAPGLQAVKMIDGRDPFGDRHFGQTFHRITSLRAYFEQEAVRVSTELLKTLSETRNLIKRGKAWISAPERYSKDLLHLPIVSSEATSQSEGHQLSRWEDSEYQYFRDSQHQLTCPLWPNPFRSFHEHAFWCRPGSEKRRFVSSFI